MPLTLFRNLLVGVFPHRLFKLHLRENGTLASDTAVPGIMHQVYMAFPSRLEQPRETTKVEPGRQLEQCPFMVQSRCTARITPCSILIMLCKMRMRMHNSNHSNSRTGISTYMSRSTRDNCRRSRMAPLRRRLAAFTSGIAKNQTDLSIIRAKVLLRSPIVAIMLTTRTTLRSNDR